MWADVVLIDGNILTMSSSRPYAEAIAIKKDKLLKVGTNREVNRWIGKNTRVISLKKKTVVPGFIDTHVHVVDFGRFLMWIDLKGVESIQEMQNIIRKRAQEIPQGKWIIGHGWNQDNFMEKRCPSLLDLDEASLDKPVILYHQFGRLCVVNSRALEFAGVAKETSAPLGGEIDKDAKTGELTGILRDNATDLVWRVIPEPDEEEIVEAVSLACEKIVEGGVTSVHWLVSSAIEIPIIQRLHAENRLPLRMYIIVPANLLTNIPCLFKDLGNDVVRIGGVEIFVDGSLAARTAALLQPYSDAPKTKGRLLYTQEEIKALIVKVRKANLQVIIHAVGDLAVDLALTAIEQTSNEVPRRNYKDRIEQAAVLNEGLIQRMKKQGVLVSVQPKCIISEFSMWSAAEHLGLKRARWLYPLKTLIREGIRVIGGSDCPMERLNPLSGIQAAVARDFFPEECIMTDEALRMYTVNAAYSSCEESIKGTIEEGKLADLTVISRDPLRVSPREIQNVEIEMTIVGGRVVYSHNSQLVTKSQIY